MKEMKEYNNLEKLPTHVRGLDELFYGGIQLHSLFDNEDCEKQGLIIVLRGPKGVHKTFFAMQILHGLTKSFNKAFTAKKYREQKKDACFFSFSKNTEELEEMYLNFIVNRQIARMIRENLSGYNDKREKIKWNENFLSFRLFDSAVTSKRQDLTLPTNFRDKLDHYICERNVHYNTRTKSLHYRTNRQVSDDSNCLYKLKYDKVGEYIENNALKNLPEHYKDDFIKIDFDIKENEVKQGTYQYPKSVNEKFQDIVNNLITYKGNEETAKREWYYPCLVIDGFSHIESEKLETMPFVTFEKALREAAPISILVFDKRYDDIRINADIIIDMDVKYDSVAEYTYHELQIAKSCFQTVAFGWHQYKKRDDGIDVFPSLHRLLQKRSYLPNILISTHTGILEETYGSYLDSVDDENKDAFGKNYETYIKDKDQNEDKRLGKIYENYKKAVDSKENLPDKCKLENVLFGRENKAYSKTTAIIGNANSFKRMFASARALKVARNGEHTLIVLFDREENDMMMRMPCPAFHQLKDKEQLNNRQCKECYKKLHFLGVRMGCISAEELFYVLQQQINVKFGDGKKFRHLIIDDLQKIDYSFPLLKNTSLFLPALITFCRNNNIELTILCDKKAERTHELCTLADNVICIKRDDEVEKEIRQEMENGFVPNRAIKLYLERSAYNTQPSEILCCKIDDVLRLFECSDGKNEKENGLRIIDDRIRCSYVCSMKDYWRQTYNVIGK